jgi:heme-degrading monooxygenase HmoA
MVDPKAAFVAAFFFSAPHDFPKVAGEAKRFAERVAPQVPGLIDISLLRNEASTELLVVSRWESKEAWSRSRWNEQLGKMLTDLVESAKSFDVRSFVPISE